MYYDLLTAEESSFDDALILADNETDVNSKNSTSEHSIKLKSIKLIPTFWIKIRVRDEHDNQVVEVRSKKF